MIIEVNKPSNFTKVHVVVHETCLILHKILKVKENNCSYINSLFHFKDYLKLVGELRTFNDNETTKKSVIEFLKENCETVNKLESKTNVIKKEDNQLSLF